jgi:hypothetical protein
MNLGVTRRCGGSPEPTSAPTRPCSARRRDELRERTHSERRASARAAQRASSEHPSGRLRSSLAHDVTSRVASRNERSFDRPDGQVSDDFGASRNTSSKPRAASEQARPRTNVSSEPVGVAEDRTLGEPPPVIGLENERQILLEPTAPPDRRRRYFGGPPSGSGSETDSLSEARALREVRGRYFRNPRGVPETSPRYIRNPRGVPEAQARYFLQPSGVQKVSALDFADPGQSWKDRCRCFRSTPAPAGRDGEPKSSLCSTPRPERLDRHPPKIVVSPNEVRRHTPMRASRDVRRRRPSAERARRLRSR